MSPDTPLLEPAPPEHTGEIVLYRTEDGRTRVGCRFVDQTVWLSQKLMADLFQRDVRTVNEHIQNVFAEGELTPQAAIRNTRITAADGKSYDVQLRGLRG